MSVQTAELRPGYAISRVIKGGWQLAGDHGPVDPAAAIADMEAFLDAGITSFDCADIYTGVEEMIGTFIADVRKRRGPDVADQVQVHTKLVPDLERLADLEAHEVEAIVDRSLQRLQIERLHLVQFYWWDTSVGAPVRAMEALKRCREKGKIAHLGVTNWDVSETAPIWRPVSIWFPRRFSILCWIGVLPRPLSPGPRPILFSFCVTARWPVGS